jgi:hypothetical protein
MIKNLDDFNGLSAHLQKDFPSAQKLTLSRDVINNPERCAHELQAFLNRFECLSSFHLCEKPLAYFGVQPAIDWTWRQQHDSEELSRHHRLRPLHATWTIYIPLQHSGYLPATSTVVARCPSSPNASLHWPPQHNLPTATTP